MSLPTELLRQVFESLSLRDLARSARVNRAISECALEKLYRDLDLNRYDDPVQPTASHYIVQRQINALTTVAKHPSIGRYVQSFQNATGYTEGDKYMDALDDLSFNQSAFSKLAAKNMTMLCRAELTRNELTTTFLKSIAFYPRLQDLSLYGLHVSASQWHNVTLPITKLRWVFPTRFSSAHPWDSTILLLKAVIYACPGLISLEISDCPLIVHPPDEKIPSQHPDFAHAERRLPHLQQLSFKGAYMEFKEECRFLADLLAFIHLHHKTLKSLTISLDPEHSPKDLEWIQKACTGLFELTSLTLLNEGTYNSAPSYGSLKHLITKLAQSNPLLESFSVSRVGGIFDAPMGRLFKSLNNIRFLHIGDGDKKDGPFDDDGTIDFKAYKLINFVRELSASIEKLHLIINAQNLFLNYEEGFGPVCEVGADAFRILPRLHTCDIIAWFADEEEGVGRYPERAVHWRRLCHETKAGPSSPPSKKIRDVLQSRMDISYMDQIYMNEEPEISQCRWTVELGDNEGNFEGRDADGDDLWSTDNLGVCGKTQHIPKRSWPWRGFPVLRYPLYQREY